MKNKEPKEKMKFPNLDSSQSVINVINEASISLGNSTRVSKEVKSDLLE